MRSERSRSREKGNASRVGFAKLTTTGVSSTVLKRGNEENVSHFSRRMLHTQRVHHPYTAKLWARWVSKIERDKRNPATHELESRGQVGSAGLKGTRVCSD